MLSSAQVRMVVLEELRDVLEDDLFEVGLIQGRERLAELELNSLSYARLVIRLEAAVGVDPFGSGELSLADVGTVDGLVAAYERAVTPTPVGRDPR